MLKCKKMANENNACDSVAAGAGAHITFLLYVNCKNNFYLNYY